MIKGVESVLGRGFGIYFAFVDPSFMLIFSDDSICKYLGMGDIPGPARLEEVFPEIVGLEDEIGRVISGGKSRFTINTITRFPERDIYFNLNFVSPGPGENGCLLVLEDVTLASISLRNVQQKRNELLLKNQELLQREEFIRILLNTIPNPIYYKDMEGRYIGCNRAFSEIAGRPEDHIIGMTATDIWGPERASLLDAMDGRLLEQKGVQAFETSITDLGGALRHVVVNKALFSGADGSPAGIVGVFNDITALKKVMEDLARSEHELQKRNRAMERSLVMARRTMAAIMQEKMPSSEHLDVHCRFLPLEGIGGDYCSVTVTGDSTSVFICDISGHGITAALFIMMIKYISERLMEVYGGDPAEFLAKLNSEVNSYGHTYYVTGQYGIFTFGAKKRFAYSSGGHPRPVLVKRGGTASFLDCTGRAIGIIRDSSFERMEVELETGDMLFFYTDGIPEARNHADEAMGFDDTLLQLFSRSIRRTLPETMDAVIGEVNAYCGGIEFNDDVLLLGFEVL